MAFQNASPSRELLSGRVTYSIHMFPACQAEAQLRPAVSTPQAEGERHLGPPACRALDTRRTSKEHKRAGLVGFFFCCNVFIMCQKLHHSLLHTSVGECSLACIYYNEVETSHTASRNPTKSSWDMQQCNISSAGKKKRGRNYDTGSLAHSFR